jgi:hypothetical protein
MLHAAMKLEGRADEMPAAGFLRAPWRASAWLVVGIALGCGASASPPAVTVHAPRARASSTPAARAVAADPLAPRPLPGPWVDGAAACAAAIAATPAGDALQRTCAAHAPFAASTSVDLAPPFRSADVVVIAERGGVAPLDRCVVVVSTARGYWLASDERVCHGPVGTGHDVVGLEVAATERGGVVRVETKLTERVLTMDRGPHGGRVERSLVRTSDDVLLCGAGASGRPSCTPPLPLVRSDWGGPPVRFAVRVERDQFELDAPAEAEQLDLDTTWRRAVGRHALRFP